MAKLGICPDCNYEPISASCVACPKCGCRQFIRGTGRQKEAECSNCDGRDFRCDKCDGTNKVILIEVKNFTTGDVYWDYRR